MRARLFPLVLAAFAVVPSVRALDWKTNHVSIDAAPFDESAEAVFPFTNDGDRPVHVVGTHPSCGCTVASLDKTDYAPGESGEIRAVFTFGQFYGHQLKTIEVATDEPGNPVYTLMLEVDIPQLIEVQRYFVAWDRNDPPDAKTITLRATRPDLLHPVRVESRDARIHVKLEAAADDPELFHVILTPETTAERLNASIVVTMNRPEKDPQVTTLYALVREPWKPAQTTTAAPQP